MPITVALLTGLFAIQFKGASRHRKSSSGRSPSFWFVVYRHPRLWRRSSASLQILWAFDPWLGLAFLGQAGFHEALLILGALMLVVTGGEAMYADLGHFGARPIRVSLVRDRLSLPSSPTISARAPISSAARLWSMAICSSAWRRGGGDLSADPARHCTHSLLLRSRIFV